MKGFTNKKCFYFSIELFGYTKNQLNNCIQPMNCIDDNEDLFGAVKA